MRSRELRSILSFLNNPYCDIKSSWFWKIVVQFMYYTGVRRLQLVTLVWRDIDFENNTVYLSVEGEKTDIERSVPLENNLLDELSKYKKRMMLINPEACLPNKQLFNITEINSRYSGTIMRDTQLTGFFVRLKRKTGISISAHVLRHTMATEIAKTGKIKPLQQILGHSNISTTLNFYVHPDMDELRGAIQGLNIN